MVQVFREVRRVLRDDGTCWVNMGDSYATSVNGRSAADTKAAGNDDRTFRDKPFSTVGNGYKPKDLMMMPARLALALQQDGWWLRSDIIWHKPNPMPESVTDRPANAHEHIYLLTKRATYFYDADAVRENTIDVASIGRRTAINGMGNGELANGDRFGGGEAGRNLRNVWTIATAPFAEAHFATFPPELAERCIKAGTSERGCCAACGKPWVRQTEQLGYILATNHAPGPNKQHLGAFGALERAAGMTANGFIPNRQRITTTTGWSAGCQCNAPTQPCTVLDPFAGAGTTGLCADRLQRNAIMIELSPAYCAMLRNRITQDAPLFAEVTDAPA